MSKQLRAQNTHSRILQSASACFSDFGYDATGVAEICRRAGVSKGAFYHHFPTTKAVFIELLNNWLERLDNQMAPVRTGAANVPDGLLALSDMVLQVFHTASKELPVILDIWAKAAREPDIWQATITPYRKYRTLIEEMIQTGINEGSIQDIDAKITAQVLVSLAVGILLQGLLDTEETEWGCVSQEGIRMLLQGIERKDRE
jgi:AcrR family transcriptional regulator